MILRCSSLPRLRIQSHEAIHSWFRRVRHDLEGRPRRCGEMTEAPDLKCAAMLGSDFVLTFH
jgi:hypothetical protein